MLTDAEIDALAKEILANSVTLIDGWTPPIFSEVHESEDGELFPVYGGTSEKQDGSFWFEYMPRAAVKKIIAKCEQVFDEFTIKVTIRETGEVKNKKISEDFPHHRNEWVKIMAETVTIHLLASVRTRICNALEDAVLDCELMAGSVLMSSLAKGFEKAKLGEVTADAREEIEKAAARVAETERKLLRRSLKGLGSIVAERGRGAPPKSEGKREQEREEYSMRVESAYRSLWSEKKEKPTKTSVAKELREGGVSPRGGDSSLSAFGNKLRRLGVDYDAITAKVDKELNNNS